MRTRLIGLGIAALVAAAAPASAQDAKAAEILAAARKAIGDRKLDALKTLSVQASIQRNVNNMQLQSETEMLLEMPDKYLRADTSSGMMNMTIATGFNGEKAILPSGASLTPGGGMMIRMGTGPAMTDPHGGEKPTPEQMEQLNRMSVRNYRQEISRLMLGWFAMPHPSLKARYLYAGEAESPDGKAHVIDVTDDEGFAARLFIDQKSRLPLMVTYKGRLGRVITSTSRGDATRGSTGQRPQQMSEEEAKKLRAEQEKKINELKTAAAEPASMVDLTLFFDEWREIDGINFPHSVRRASEGVTNEEWTIRKVKVNPKIDASKFAVGTN